jgi:Rps23 Pro-64 3,4-dihydroxylase Tpa1-like proline 4-hydroxylase
MTSTSNSAGDQRPRGLFDDRNDNTRIDLFEELTDQISVALRAFCRRLGAPHLFDERIAPMLREGDSYLFVTVRDRPWPPWGIGARHISAACHVHKIADDTFSLSPVYVTDDDVGNVGLQSALLKEALEFLAVNDRADVAFVAAEGSTLADAVLRRYGFERGDDVVLTEHARYLTYRCRAAKLLAELGLDGTGTPALFAHAIEPDSLSHVAGFTGGIYLASRADWLADQPSEIINLMRGSHATKPGGVPSGSGRFTWVVDPAPERSAAPLAVGYEGFLGGDVQTQLLQHLMERQGQFSTATVARAGEEPHVDPHARKAATLDDLGAVRTLFVQRLQAALPEVLDKLQYPAFPVGDIELQVTASNHGDYYRLHLDADEQSTREISFVYYLFKEPAAFTGGELRLYATEIVNGRRVPVDRIETYLPRQDAVMFFPARHEHEVLPVRVPSRDFGDSRFTVNGWIHRRV